MKEEESSGSWWGVALIKALTSAAESEKSHMLVLFVCAAMFMMGWYVGIPTMQILVGIATMVLIALAFPCASAYLEVKKEEMRLRAMQTQLLGSGLPSEKKSSAHPSGKQASVKRRRRR